jgi:peptidyl-prolyl cis-trans isomerase A (cyclophilin A)
MRWRFGVIVLGTALAATLSAVRAQETAQIETSLGTIVIALDRTHAPKTVANFIAYARERHFDGTMVYRVEPGFVIQMGSYQPDGSARPVHAPIPLESANGLTNARGSVAMARADDPTSATAEFFIDLANNANLDAKPEAPSNTTGYTVFGSVVSGMDVVDKIAATSLGGKGPFPPGSTPARPIEIRKVIVSEAGTAVAH